MKNKSTLFILICFLCSSIAYGQAKDQAVDEHALADTRVKGKMSLDAGVMSTPASELLITSFIQANPNEEFYLFPERRENRIELLETIPVIWCKRSKQEREVIKLNARPGEYLVFQVGVFAPFKSLEAIKFNSKGLKTLTCFNLEGINNMGDYFDISLNVDKDKLQPLWFGLQIPSKTNKKITGSLDISANNSSEKSIKVEIEVEGENIQNNGFNEDYRLSRLAWLNSKIAHDDQTTKLYQPIRKKSNTLGILGRDIVLNPAGLPEQIISYYNHSNSKIEQKGEDLLSCPLEFIIEYKNGEIHKMNASKFKITKQSPAHYQWQSSSSTKELDITLSGHLESEGALTYDIQIAAKKEIEIKDIRLEIAMANDKSTYMMGMGKEGGYRPNQWDWRWDVDSLSQDMIWVGDVNGGISLKLKDINYRKPLVNIYYPYGPLREPISWSNKGDGGCRISTLDTGALINAFSGSRTIKAQEVLNFNFELLVTPFKLLSSSRQFTNRHYHNSNDDVSNHFIDDAKNVGANLINIHHRKDLNPFINYPYLSENIDDLKEFINKAHSDDIRVKLYYTTREITVNAPEIWAFKSLGDEIIFPGPGALSRTVINPDGPDQWLSERIKKDFIPAWKCSFTKGKFAGQQDLAVVTTPESRLDNFYLEGLNWLAKYAHIDGVYLDGTALDRTAMRRARKILDKNRDSANIDMHIWNNFREKGYYASGINLYLDQLPFIDQLWIGEGRSYDRSPDYWLIEMAGIPFGLSSQMLNQGGNRWRGMVFGMTNRAGWYGPTPKYIWDFWDKNEFSKMDFMGYWDKEYPIHSDNKNIISSSYRDKNKMIIALANWADDTQIVNLTIDWKAVGLDPALAKVYIPNINEYQTYKELNSLNNISVKGSKGYLIVIESKDN